MAVENQPFLSSSKAILIGCAMISLAILISNGKITLKGNQASLAATQPQNAVPTQPGPKTEADIVKNLKSYAGKLGLDQNKFNSCLDAGSKAALVQVDKKDGGTAGVEGTPAFFINGHLVGGALPYNMFKQILDYTIAGGNWNNVSEDLKYLVDGNLDNGEISQKVTSISEGNLPIEGSVNAPVTIVEFSDYQCPYCGRFYQNSETQIRKNYVDSGKVKIYYRDFPLDQIIPQTGLPMHPGADKAAEAARCAGDQGKYWEFHDLVFENQSSIF